MFQSLHNVVKKSFWRNNSQDPTPNPTPDCNRNDRLEDGFLLVGQTASERTIVTSEGFRSDRINPPPCYDEVGRNGLPTYTAFNANRSMYSPTLNVPGSSTQYPPDPTLTALPTIQGPIYNSNHEDLNRFTSPITDIPFVVAGRFANSRVLEDLKRSSFLGERRFNVSSYDYDFRLEMSVLREHVEVMDER